MIIITIIIIIIIITNIIMILTCSEGGARGDQEAGDGRVEVAHPGVDPGVRGAVGVHREENCLRQAELEESIYRCMVSVCLFVILLSQSVQFERIIFYSIQGVHGHSALLICAALRNYFSSQTCTP